MATGVLEQSVDQGVESRPSRGRADGLFDFVERLPGPAVLWYIALVPVLCVAFSVPTWVVGHQSIGTIYPPIVAPSVLAAYFLGVIGVLNGIARGSLRDFRPALVAHPDADRLGADLTHIRDRSAGIAIAVLEVVITAGFFSSEAARQRLAGLPVPIAGVEMVAWWLAVAAAALLILHVAGQLRQVGRLHSAATVIDLFDRGPIVAFARLTSALGVSLLLVAIGFLAAGAVQGTDDLSTFQLSQPIAFVALAIAAFLLPLLGMHERMAAEKARLLRETHRRLRATIDRVHAGVDENDLATADELNKTFASLVAERDLVGRLSTWPWSPGVLRGFASAVLLPIVIWALIRVLERVV